MSRFTFPPSIHSRPVYGTLSPRKGSGHLMIADAEGAEALLGLARADAALMASAHVIFIPRDTGNRYVTQLQAAAPAVLHIGASYDASVPRIRRVLADTVMGAQIYLAGTEGLIGQAMNEALNAGIPLAAIQTEHRGSVARRVQCVHCKGITEDVTTDPFTCSHCGLNLFVRDHYSRRLAAFQGVCIDAEDPGNVPPPVELYS
ncbi:dimethylamine monooxygenase subunit DmmA family protein [Roseinatronobacter alkalisoli]|uniref:Dimethylamine monooxygenase subunit DmmA family protein n=1 Tax=Roseinatronobacter alkalisoli TaxID=3028235 RepID=A0ABT5T9X2_9RHOB|nr:dimethylamine monooxygenase subunit DmmA family protein [Roseinatronobacter sp. HJB301]MDD7970728.1 dimethylamine monooxygenase subunit DmmA family protein [Roseinatronobacter sp. HJB301]